MMQPRRTNVLILLCSSFALALAALVVTSLLLRPDAATAGPNVVLPENDPERGLIYDGLEVATDGPCKGIYRLKQSGLCTHGPDQAPPSVRVTTQEAPAPLPAPVSASAVCEDTSSGYRTQVIYARAANSPNGNRHATYLASFRQWLAEADAIYDASAAETGGGRRIRFVTDTACNVAILDVTLSAGAAASLDNTVAELKALGHDAGDRKYFVFMDANVLCGLSTIYNDDRPGVENYNNGGYAGYSRVDVPCWNAHTIAHEHMHTLGGVQNTAPHASGGGHCVDDYDVMCYSDAPNYPTVQYLCPATSHETRFDCGNDDYFSTNPPPGSYLATRWNTADSRFLIQNAGPTIALASPSPSPVATPVPTPSPSARPSAPPTPAPSPTPATAAGTHTLTIVGARNGLIAPSAGQEHAPGSVVALRATPANGFLFTGWVINGQAAGWANPHSLTIAGDHTVTATFVAAPTFGDLPTNDPAYNAIRQLAARGIIRGYDPATFGPADGTLRAQMAALIARAMGWGSENPANPFGDQNGVDNELWKSVGILAAHGVARGYSDGRGGSYYDPTAPVLRAQTVSFITRAMIAKGYWQARPADPTLYGGVLNGTGHEADVATYLHYTRAQGGIPDEPTSGTFGTWDEPSTRAWFARTLWVALDGTLGTK